MRVIERKMINALRNNKGMKCGNTMVVWFTDHAKVYLHGNMIAQYYPSNGELFLSDCGWQTNTTKSRLNSLLQWRNLSNIYQKNWAWYRGDTKWNRFLLINTITGATIHG